MYKPQIKVPATYMRGGTSKGVFFKLEDLPEAAQVAGEARDALFLRVIGSPDPYAKQIDGMGGATSSTSKTVIVSKSKQPDHDVDYLFGQVSIDQAFVDWSGNCGNLSAAVGAYAIHAGLIDNKRLPEQGRVDVRIWQVNIQKTIIVSVPVLQGEVIETGDFELDGVTFPAAELPVTFVDPADGEGKLFPTGNLIDSLDIPELGNIDATLINAGIPTVFIRAQDVNCTGTELQDQINNDPQALALFERIRAIGAVKMGLIQQESEAQQCQHTPKIAFVASATRYQSSSGKTVEVDDIQLLVRALSMGKLHHAMMGTASVAIATAAAVPGTLVNHYAGEGHLSQVCFGHPSGTLTVGASVNQQGEDWLAEQVTMSRSARILMSGEVYLPQ